MRMPPPKRLDLWLPPLVLMRVDSAGAALAAHRLLARQRTPA
jgi:hypothetical protein